jgi:uncharacterized protein (UPF0248 family)
MIPIHELLSRIHWDKDFGQGDFKIGFYDRIEDKIMYISLKEMRFMEDDHFSFEITDHGGITHTIPFHRIRQVYKNNELIWNRES